VYIFGDSGFLVFEGYNWLSDKVLDFTHLCLSFLIHFVVLWQGICMV